MPPVPLPSLVGGENGCVYTVSENGAAKAAKLKCKKGQAAGLLITPPDLPDIYTITVFMCT